MTALLNLLPLAMLVAGFFALKAKRPNLLLVIAALGTVYLILQPSYLPKGHVERSEAPPPPVASAASAQSQDRTSKPMPLAERDQKLREDVQRGLDFQHPAK